MACGFLPSRLECWLRYHAERGTVPPQYRRSHVAGKLREQMATIYGTTGSDIRNGTSGSDTIYGWARGGNARSPSGNDTLNGNAGNDKLLGGTGNDTLNGGLGIDTLIGGAGNDTYIVNSTTDTIIEYANGGATDTVQSSVSYTLGKYLNNLTLTGVSNINGTGNKLNNTIYGNSEANILDGKAGNDTLYGGDGDTLYGGTGNDLLETYSSFDGSSFSGSTPFLYGGDGNDTLRGNLADMYGGDGNDNLSGSLNEMRGDDGNDVLTGYASRLYGGNGDDTLSAGVYSDEGGFGSSTANGGNGNDVLAGYGAILAGGNGNDTLTGYSYTFSNLEGPIGEPVYSHYLFNAPSEGVDTIVQFALNGDQIDVSASGFGGGLTSGAAITPEQLVLGSAATDTNERFIYNQNTGALFFDSDGTGATEQVQFAILPTGLAMTNASIVGFE